MSVKQESLLTITVALKTPENHTVELGAVVGFEQVLVVVEERIGDKRGGGDGGGSGDGACLSGEGVDVTTAPPERDCRGGLEEGRQAHSTPDLKHELQHGRQSSLRRWGGASAGRLNDRSSTSNLEQQHLEGLG